MVAFGVLFALLVTAGGLAEGDLAAVPLVVIFGLLMTAIGVSLATAVVRVDSSGIRYRYVSVTTSRGTRFSRWRLAQGPAKVRPGSR